MAGPVYAHHLHYNVVDAIEALPLPGPSMGRLAIPMVTYGAINSGVALEEAGKALVRTGRLVIGGAKLAAG